MLVTLYKKTISRLLIVTACLFFGQMVNAQRYPVQIVPQLLPPYTLNVSDYYNGTNEKLVLLLTNTDLNKPNLQVRLRMSIQGQSAKLISRDNVFYPAINLDGGVATRITLSDLAPYFNADNLIFEGITRAQYVQSGKLPEGFYQFCFEAVEINSNQVVGRSSCAMAWISLNDPPLLNMPRKAESIVYKDPQNIIFQWTPRNFNSPTSAFNTEYEFTLVEIWDNGLAPEAAFGTAQPLYRTTTPATTLLYGPGQPLLLSGHRYAWRIRAQMANGSGTADVWRNNGYSEIYWFNCQNNCAAPLNVQHEISGGRATITWSPNPNQFNFTVDYREKGQSDASWYSAPTTSQKMLLYDLKKDKTYEYRVGGTCDNSNSTTYSDIKTMVMTSKDSADDGACGLLTADVNITNRTAINTLLNGDVITVSDYPVKLLQVSGQGSFTGSGYVTIPFLGHNRVKVKFSGITVNTDKELIGGIIETTYDPKEGQITNFDEVINGGSGVGIITTGVDTAGYYVDMVIPDAGSIHVDLSTTVDSDGKTVPTGGGTLSITGSDGTVKEVKVEQLPATVKDRNGTVYNVDKEGNVTKVASSVPMNMTATQLNTLQTDKAVVSFKPYGKQLYAFDEYTPVYRNSNEFNEEYEKLNTGYYVNAKAIGEGKADIVKAVAEIKDNNSIKADSIQFVTAKGTKFESTRQLDGSWEIKIVGGPAGDGQELYAVYPQGGGKYLPLGKLNIYGYAERTFKVVLVPVKGAKVDKDAISSQLDAVYKPLGISFQVTQDQSFDDDSWDLVHDNKLAVSGSGWLSTLTDEMKALNKAYSNARTVQQDAVYLFVLNGSDSTIAGDMPRGKQFGYLFNGTDGKAAAHEIGHGLFKLLHTFDKEYGFSQGQLPSNVMDYPAGNRFAKIQWDQLYKPGVVIGLFEKEADGQLQIVDINAFKDLKNASTNTYTFLSPGGLPVTLPATATNIILSETNYFMSKEDSKYLHTEPFGTLISFTLKNGDQTELYTAVGKTDDRKFVEYYCKACNGNKGKAYVDNLSAKETSGNVILAWPCFDKKEDADELYYTVKARLFPIGNAAWEKTKVQNYGAGGLFSDAEMLLEEAANKYYDLEIHPAYTVSEKARTFSDFSGSKAASTFIKDCAACDRMPYPVVMNIANLIQLNEAGFADFVNYKKDGEESAYVTKKYGVFLEKEEDFFDFLEEFQDYLKAYNKPKPLPPGVHDLKIEEITESNVMEYTLDKYIPIDQYASLTLAERIQILKVLLPGSSTAEKQLINVISTIPDKDQARKVADFLNGSHAVLLRLIQDVNEGANHDDMMATLYNMCKKKDDHGDKLTEKDVVGKRLYYKGNFDYGQFSITSTINSVNLVDIDGRAELSIEMHKEQVFSSNTPINIVQKYTTNFNGTNGITWEHLNPLDFVIVIFEQDFTVTGSGVVFKKGDIVRLPALYLWELYDQDAKKTAELLLANSIKLAATGASLIGLGTAEPGAETLLAALDLASEAYSVLISPNINRAGLNPAEKQIVEAFDALGELYMTFRGGEEVLTLGEALKDYTHSWGDKIRAGSLFIDGAEEYELYEKLKSMVEFVQGKLSDEQPESNGTPAPVFEPVKKGTIDPAIKAEAPWNEEMTGWGIDIKLLNKDIEDEFVSIKTAPINNIKEEVNLVKLVAFIDNGLYTSYAASGYPDKKSKNILIAPTGAPPITKGNSVFQKHIFMVDGRLKENDSDVKVLEEFALKHGAQPNNLKPEEDTQQYPDVKGSITFYSQLCVCPSCTKVFIAFKKMFPNVDIVIYSMAKKSWH